MVTCLGLSFMENKSRYSIFLLCMAFLIAPVAFAAESPAVASDGLRIIDRVRFYPAPGDEKDMVSGRFTGSNTDTGNDFVLLGEIKDVPESNAWTELHLDAAKPYRFLRYESPPGSHCRIAELEFLAGDQRLRGPAFSSTGSGEAPGL